MQAFFVAALTLLVTIGASWADASEPQGMPPSLGDSAPEGQTIRPPSQADESKLPIPARKPLAEETMDQLFATLANPADETRGKAAEQEIQRRWQRSGSATIDLLMSWAQQSLAAKEYGRSLDFLDQVVMLKPDFAEGWNRRATIYYLRDDYGKALGDLEKVLALEPRHFGALAGIGMIFQDIDRKADALAAFEKALALDPYLDPDIKNAIKTLGPEVRGKEI